MKTFKISHVGQDQVTEMVSFLNRTRSSLKRITIHFKRFNFEYGIKILECLQSHPLTELNIDHNDVNGERKSEEILSKQIIYFNLLGSLSALKKLRYRIYYADKRSVENFTTHTLSRLNNLKRLRINCKAGINFILTNFLSHLETRS